MLTSTALVLLMIPGLAMFYGGLVRTKNVLGTMMHCFAAMAIVGVLWVVCGYSMSFGSNVLGGWFGWDSRYLFLRGIDDTIMEEGIPEYVFAMFQGKFAIITPVVSTACSKLDRLIARGVVTRRSVWGAVTFGSFRGALGLSGLGNDQSSCGTDPAKRSSIVRCRTKQLPSSLQGISQAACRW